MLFSSPDKHYLFIFLASNPLTILPAPNRITHTTFQLPSKQNLDPQKDSGAWKRKRLNEGMGRRRKNACVHTRGQLWTHMGNM